MHNAKLNAIAPERCLTHTNMHLSFAKQGLLRLN
jgi:hypothetical protein